MRRKPLEGTALQSLPKDGEEEEGGGDEAGMQKVPSLLFRVKETYREASVFAIPSVSWLIIVFHRLNYSHNDLSFFGNWVTAKLPAFFLSFYQQPTARMS